MADQKSAYRAEQHQMVDAVFTDLAKRIHEIIYAGESWEVNDQIAVPGSRLGSLSMRVTIDCGVAYVKRLGDAARKERTTA
jgi:hypothetical protein